MGQVLFSAITIFCIFCIADIVMAPVRFYLDTWLMDNYIAKIHKEDLDEKMEQ